MTPRDALETLLAEPDILVSNETKNFLRDLGRYETLSQRQIEAVRRVWRQTQARREETQKKTPSGAPGGSQMYPRHSEDTLPRGPHPKRSLVAAIAQDPEAYKNILTDSEIEEILRLKESGEDFSRLTLSRLRSAIKSPHGAGSAD